MAKTRIPLPPATERALLEVLLDKTQSSAKFKAICDRNPSVFGSPSSDLRRRVQKRRQHFKANPTRFSAALKSQVTSPTKDTGSAAACAHDSISEEEEESNHQREQEQTPKKPPRKPLNQITPPSSKRGNKMSHLRAKAPTTGSTYELNFDEPWKNPFGILTIKGTKVVEEKTVMDKLTILKPIFDINDYEKNLFQGRLLPDGSGIIVTEPTIPGYVWENAKEIQELVDSDGKVCEPSLLTFKTIRTDMKKNRDLRTQENTYRFPDGVTCNNEYFNKLNRRSSQYDLDAEMYLHEQKIGENEKGDAIMQYCPFIVFKMAIDGDGKQTEDADDEVRGINKAFARLGIKTKEPDGRRLDEATPAPAPPPPPQNRAPRVDVAVPLPKRKQSEPTIPAFSFQKNASSDRLHDKKRLVANKIILEKNRKGHLEFVNHDRFGVPVVNDGPVQDIMTDDDL